MKQIKRYFGEFNMTWPRVILIAVVTAVYTALMNVVPFLEDTSFQHISVATGCISYISVFYFKFSTSLDQWDILFSSDDFLCFRYAG